MTRREGARKGGLRAMASIGADWPRQINVGIGGKE